MQLLDYIVIVIYLGAVVGAGWYFSREQEEQEDYFVGGRQLPWLAVGLSIVATMLSTVSYLAAPGEVIQHGLALSMGWLAMPLAFVVVNFLWVPFFMRLGVTSIYEYLEHRFGLTARLTAVGLFVFILRMFWMATIVLTASRAVAQITHTSLVELFNVQVSLESWTLIVLLAVGVFATFYTMLGGIKAVVWTDVAQFIALFAGLVFTLIFVAWHTGTGPLDWWRTTTSDAGAGHDFPPLASFDITTRNTVLFTVLSSVFWYACTFIGDQVAVQRYLTTPSVGAALKSNIVNFAADFIVMVMLAVCGMALLTYYLDPAYQTEIANGVTDPRDPAVADKVFPHFIAHGLPVGISGLVVAALFAVAMSSLDSGINSVAAVLTIDVFRRLSRAPSNSKKARVDNSLTLPRAITVVVGLLCTILAWILLSIPERYNIIGITARTFNCALGPLAAMFVVGMFVKRAGEKAVVIAAAAGLTTAICLAWWVEIMWAVGLTDYATLDRAVETLAGPSPFLITPIAATLTFVIGSCLSWVFPNTRLAETEALLWRSIVASKEKRQ
ncbi:MAG: sodium/solute symporter [Pirellulaceae bacterium]|jgi:SSS family solute:Na+ symporter|nr:sodium/solute symporter [Pirellulaceae bacterium]MDP7014676.1 sodium/solute symporter [Pirellulaceae bacterium]